MDEKQVAGDRQSGSSSPPQKVSVNTVHDHAGIADRDLDQAYKYLESKDDGLPSSEGINLAALRRKIDWRIVPIMFACYTMQFIDKVSLNVSG